jgi:hypothetical protein
VDFHTLPHEIIMEIVCFLSFLTFSCSKKDGVRSGDGVRFPEPSRCEQNRGTLPEVRWENKDTLPRNGLQETAQDGSKMLSGPAGRIGKDETAPPEEIRRGRLKRTV